MESEFLYCDNCLTLLDAIVDMFTVMSKINLIWKRFLHYEWTFFYLVEKWLLTVTRNRDLAITFQWSEYQKVTWAASSSPKNRRPYW